MDIDDIGNVSPGQGPLNEEQSEPMCKPIRIVNHPIYLNNYFSLVKIVEDLDPSFYTQAMNLHDVGN